MLSTHHWMVDRSDNDFFAVPFLPSCALRHVNRWPIAWYRFASAFGFDRLGPVAQTVGSRVAGSQTKADADIERRHHPRPQAADGKIASKDIRHAVVIAAAQWQ